MLLMGQVALLSAVAGGRPSVCAVRECSQSTDGERPALAGTGRAQECELIKGPLVWINRQC